MHGSLRRQAFFSAGSKHDLQLLHFATLQRLHVVHLRGMTGALAAPPFDRMLENIRSGNDKGKLIEFRVALNQFGGWSRLTFESDEEYPVALVVAHIGLEAWWWSSGSVSWSTSRSVEAVRFISSSVSTSPWAGTGPHDDSGSLCSSQVSVSRELLEVLSSMAR